MTDAFIDRLIEAVLYEGFILYPYRPSVKNTQRWTFGGLYSREFCESQQSVESPVMQTQCLMVGNDASTVTVEFRFLRLIDRRIGRLTKPLNDWPLNDELEFEPVASLTVGQRQFHSWQEAAEQKLAIDDIKVGEIMGTAKKRSFEFPPSVNREPIVDDDGRYVGLVERAQHALTGSIELRAEQVAESCFRLTLRAENETHLDGLARYNRDEASLYSFAAAHAVLVVNGGKFISQIDPPERWRELAAANENIGVWPVLVAEAPDRTAMLASPIILYDYPQIAPESPTDLFDSTEVDEILTLRILTLTDAEKDAMRAVDPRSRKLLDHVESLGSRELLQLHGTIRDVGRNSFRSEVVEPNLFRSHEQRNEFRSTEDPFDPWRTTPEQAMQSVIAHSMLLVPGDRVRLAPRPGADIFDLVLAGKVATIHSIEHDLEGQIYLAVTIDEDPGRDLGEQLQPGHRFFFKLDEVEPLAENAARER